MKEATPEQIVAFLTANDNTANNGYDVMTDEPVDVNSREAALWAETMSLKSRNEWLQGEIERLRDHMPPHFIPPRVVREFMAHRHFWAAHEIDIVARKDGKEYRLEGDWLKDACRTLAAMEEPKS